MYMYYIENPVLVNSLNFLGTVIKNFTVTDSDSTDDIQVLVIDPTTKKYVNVTVYQTQGNSVLVSVSLRISLDRDRVSIILLFHIL